MIQSTIGIFFAALTIYAGLSDIFTMTIPNRISLLLVGGFVLAALLVGLSFQQILFSLAGGLTVLALGFACFAFRWIGGGDAKLAAAAALWLGFDHVLEYLLLAMLGGGALAVAMLAMRSFPLPAFTLEWTWLNRLHDRTNGIPYGVALSAAALLIYPSTPLWLAAA
jgi:prepilin peptidase CpaA